MLSINVNPRLQQATVEFLWWVVGWGGMHSHFHVQPNYSADVVADVVLWLCCVVVGVVTIENHSKYNNI